MSTEEWTILRQCMRLSRLTNRTHRRDGTGVASQSPIQSRRCTRDRSRRARGFELWVRTQQIRSPHPAALAGALGTVVCLIIAAASAGTAQNLVRPVRTEQAAQELGIDLSRPLTAEDCVAIALRVHPDIRMAVAELDRATAGLRQLRASLWPQLSASIDYRVTQQPTRTAVIGGSVIPVGGGRSTTRNSQLFATITAYHTGRDETISQAKEFARAARAGMADAERQLAYLVTQAYYGRLAAERLVDVSAKAVAAAEDHVETVQARIDARDAAPMEIHAVRTQLHSALLELSVIRNQADIARTTLWSALGMPEADLQIVDMWREPISLPGLDECIETAFVQRPDIAQAEASVRAARLGLKLACLARRPQLNVAGTTEWGRHNGETGTSWSVFGSIEQTIFSGGANQAAVDQAKAQVESALAQLDRLEQSVHLEVETAWLRVNESAERITAAELAQVEAQVSLEAAERRYEANVGILLEVTDAQVNATNANVSVVRAYYDYNTSLADLELATGSRPAEIAPPEK